MNDETSNDTYGDSVWASDRFTRRRLDALAVAASIPLIAGCHPSYFMGGSRRHKLADRTPPAHRRFPVPKRK